MENLFGRSDDSLSMISIDAPMGEIGKYAFSLIPPFNKEGAESSVEDFSIAVNHGRKTITYDFIVCNGICALRSIALSHIRK